MCDLLLIPIYKMRFSKLLLLMEVLFLPRMVNVRLESESLKKKSDAKHVPAHQAERLPLTMADVDRTFTKLVVSIGYSADQYDRILRSFSLERKIKAIVSLLKGEEQLEHLQFYTRHLHGVCSLVALLFLTALLQGSDSPDFTKPGLLYRQFMKDGGAALLRSLMRADEPIFLKCLLKLVLHLERHFGASFALHGAVVAKYGLLPKDAALRYLNSGCAEDWQSLDGSAESVKLGILEIIKDVLAMDRIDNKLEFLLHTGIATDGMLSSKDLDRNKFSDDSSYQRLLSLCKKSAIVTNIKEEARGSKALNGKINETKEAIASQESSAHINPELEKLRIAIKEKEGCIEGMEAKHKAEISSFAETVKSLEAKIKGMASEIEQLKASAKELIPVKSEENKVKVESLDNLKINTNNDADKPTGVASNTVKKTTAKPFNNPFKLGIKKPTATADSQPVNGKIGSGKPKLGLFGLKKPKPSIFAGKSYSGLKWNKTGKSAGSIFERIDSVEAEKKFNLADFVPFEKVTVARPETLKKAASSSPTQVKDNAAACWDVKKSNALNIALGRIRLSDERLLQQIIALSLDNENLVNQFIMYFPTADEFNVIKRSTAVLGRAETFFLLAGKLEKTQDQFPSKLLSALHTIKFNMLLQNRDYRTTLSLQEKRFARILNSKELVKLFSTLLATGNVLNISTFNGNASAFSLDSLDIFKQKELLSLISKHVSKETLLKELISPSDANLPAVEEIKREIQELRNAFVEDAVGKEAASEFSCILDSYNQMIATYNKTCAYFNITDDTFISKVLGFVTSLN